MTTEGLTAITSTVLILHVCGARVCIPAQNATSLVTLALPALPGYLLRQPELHLRVQPAAMWPLTFRVVKWWLDWTEWVCHQRAVAHRFTEMLKKHLMLQFKENLLWLLFLFTYSAVQKSLATPYFFILCQENAVFWTVCKHRWKYSILGKNWLFSILTSLKFSILYDHL